LNPAQLLIERFKSANHSRARPSGPASLSMSMHASQANASPAQQRAGNIISKLHVELEPWCEVVVL
jgi:hypothetical protein